MARIEKVRAGVDIRKGKAEKKVRSTDWLEIFNSI